jgi:hypothetical protein
MATSTKVAPHGGYERSDASPRGVLYFALLMAAILAAASFSLIGLFKYFQKAANPGSFVAAPFATERPMPPPPRIQPNPGADLQDYYQSQEKLLNSYGWIDRQNGIVRLPIYRAMELLVERGLPTRPAITPETRTTSQKGNPSTNNAKSRGPAR